MACALRVSWCQSAGDAELSLKTAIGATPTKGGYQVERLVVLLAVDGARVGEKVFWLRLGRKGVVG